MKRKWDLFAVFCLVGLLILLALLMSGCAVTAENSSSVWQIEVAPGKMVVCVAVGGDTGASGVDCNWEAYNDGS